jgi:hypothetical protein
MIDFWIDSSLYVPTYLGSVNGFWQLDSSPKMVGLFGGLRQLGFLLDFAAGELARSIHGYKARSSVEVTKMRIRYGSHGTPNPTLFPYRSACR